VSYRCFALFVLSHLSSSALFFSRLFIHTKSTTIFFFYVLRRKEAEKSISPFYENNALYVYSNTGVCTYNIIQKREKTRERERKNRIKKKYGGGGT